MEAGAVLRAAVENNTGTLAERHEPMGKGSPDEPWALRCGIPSDTSTHGPEEK